MTFVKTILQQMPSLSKCRMKFLLNLFSALYSFVGRANMRNLSRFGAGNERTISRWYSKPFDWHRLNIHALRSTGVLKNRLVACYDCTFIPKSGKHTYGLDRFHHGSHSRRERGLEAAVLGLVDLDEHTAYTIEAAQTPPKQELKLAGKTRIDFYIEHILSHAPALQNLGIKHILLDGAFAKVKVFDRLTEAGLHVITKLRSDTHMRHLYRGEPNSGSGAKRKYDGKVDWNDLSRFECMKVEDEDTIVYWQELNHPHFKRNLLVVFVEKPGASYKLASSDLGLSPLEIYRLYSARFQQEFVFRDAKQFMGLTHAQVRDKTKLKEHLNASLSALNLLRLQDRHLQDCAPKRTFSASIWKRRYLAKNIAESIFSNLGFSLKREKSILAASKLPFLRDIAS